VFLLLNLFLGLVGKMDKNGFSDGDMLEFIKVIILIFMIVVIVLSLFSIFEPEPIECLCNCSDIIRLP